MKPTDDKYRGENSPPRNSPDKAQPVPDKDWYRKWQKSLHQKEK